MITTFTENDLLRYLYGEYSDYEKTDIETALICDTELEEKFDDLKSETSMLDGLFFTPSNISIENIFNFSLGFSIDNNS